MKTIMIDVDDVITKTGEKLLEKFNEYSDTKYNINDILTYDLQDYLPSDKKEKFIEEYRTINLYENIELKENVVEVIKRLSEKHKVYIVTAYLFLYDLENSKNNLKDKYEYLRKTLPFIDPNNIIFTNNKNMIYFDIKIDDRAHNLEKNAKEYLLFDCYHNKNIELGKNTTRVYNWLEIEKLINEREENERNSN